MRYSKQSFLKMMAKVKRSKGCSIPSNCKVKIVYLIMDSISAYLEAVATKRFLKEPLAHLVFESIWLDCTYSHLHMTHSLKRLPRSKYYYFQPGLESLFLILSIESINWRGVWSRFLTYVWGELRDETARNYIDGKILAGLIQSHVLTEKAC